jgi:uncharacterized membrane protein YbhN (UPF0104 family)
MIQAMSSIHFKWGIAAAFCIIFATSLGAFNAYLLLNRQNSLLWTNFLPIYWLAWAVSLVTPGQIGDLAIISTSLKKQNIDWHLSLGRSLLDKAISFTIMAILAVIGLYFTSRKYIGFEQSSILMLEIFMSIVLILYLLRFKLTVFFSPELGGVRGLLGQTIQEAKVTIYHHPARILINIVLTTIKIFLIGASYWCIFKGLGAGNIELIETVALAAASSLVAYIPISFNGIGTVEASGLVLFSQIGLSTSSILAGYLGLRLLVISLAWLPSACILLLWRCKTAK